MKVPCRRLLCERRNSFLSVPLRGFGAYLQHRFYRDACHQRRTIHCPCHPLLDFFLPRFPSKVEKPKPTTRNNAPASGGRRPTTRRSRARRGLTTAWSMPDTPSVLKDCFGSFARAFQVARIQVELLV